MHLECNLNVPVKGFFFFHFNVKYSNYFNITTRSRQSAKFANYGCSVVSSQKTFKLAKNQGGDCYHFSVDDFSRKYTAQRQLSFTLTVY